MKLPLRYYGDPILRKKAQPITEITAEIRSLAADMIETMLFYKGIGLAATQVGSLHRLFVSNVDHEDQEGNVILGEPIVYINPVLSLPSEALVERSEGCLSIPKLYLPVSRPLSVTIQALDLEGRPFKKEQYAYIARCMMHENDHLNGVLFIDRLSKKRRKEAEPHLQQIKKTKFLT